MVLSPVFQLFHADFESAISEGKLSFSEYKLTIEGVDSYRLYKFLETELNRVDYLSQLTLRRAESRVAEFNFTSTLSTEEVAQRIQSTAFGGFHLKPVRVDSKSLSVRYSK